MRDRLIKLFKKIEYTPFPEMTMKSNLGNQFTDYALSCIVDELLANGVTVQEWISVKDRLPDVGRDVLFVCENKSYGVGAYSDTYRDFFSGQFPVKGVTHWMPLPQPPKGE